jgi:O-glycosyl hydrolase
MRMKSLFLFALLSAVSLQAAEKATYDSGGGLVSVIDHGAELPLAGAPFVEFTGGLTFTAEPHEQRSPVTRDGYALTWRGSSTYPNATKTHFMSAWSETSDGLKLNLDLGADSMLDLHSLDYVLDLPRDVFVGGTVGERGGKFPEHRPANIVFFRADTASLQLASADGSWKLALTFDGAHPVSITDEWNKHEHVYRLRVGLHEGFWTAKEPVHFALTLKAEASPRAAVAHVSVNPTERLYSFDGFGGDYCFDVTTPAVEYTMDNLPSAWARLEFKAFAWDRQRTDKGNGELAPELKRDFELMQRVQKTGAPWILSLWRLPERYYADPNAKPTGTFDRQIPAERWPEFLDLLGSYIEYGKKHYHVEPTFFSFNEPDLGVDIGFTGETHRDAIKRIGEYFATHGIKTKLLLGDTANPRDSHVFTLPTAADDDALKYVGAVSFHSWGNGTAKQYQEWRDVGQWLQLPLIVGEAGSDPGFYRNYAFDSYAYGLRDAEQYQHLLRDAQPKAIIYWEYSEDYGLVHVSADKVVTPTPRFYLMKQFVALTPTKSEVVASESDQPDVLVSAFAKNGVLAVHIVNRGAEREVALSGLPAGNWREVTTTEESGFRETALSAAPTTLKIPARSMVSLVKKE